ncbi:SRPBCC domain-containing protein [Caulobacter soli]|uniref:SRPBCC domain-containing protein n=1 Tax=Caulobacter soli TaxID=2708539 RepID=UPI0013E9BFA9|nr:SRPBCC domain-containing protein [Caulobacter soli]
MPLPTTRASRLIPASPDAVWAALMDPKALEQWLPPGDMTGAMHAFDGRVGGGFEMSLYYPEDEARQVGKTAEREDRTRVRFAAIAPGRQVVWAVLFDTDDPTLKGEMTITLSLEPAPDGTRVTLLSENLPPGLRPADNKEGSKESLKNLAAWFGG